MIEIKNISKEYEKPYKKALDNVSLTLPENGLVIIKGKSGSGKTTLLNIIAGYEKPTSGEVIGLTSNDVAMMFQDYRLITYLTVFENLKIICDLYKVDYFEIDELLNKFEIAELKDHYPNQISLGECLRVSLARALLSHKHVLLIDEPTKSLDDDNVERIYELLYSISSDHLVIVVSHDSYFFNQPDLLYMIELSDGKLVSKSENIIKDYSLTPTCCAHLSVKNSVYIANKIFAENKKKYIFLIIILILSFSLILVSLVGITTSYSDLLISNAKEKGYDKIEFVNKASDVNYSAIDYNFYNNMAKKESVFPFVYKSVSINNELIDCNIYFTNTYYDTQINNGEILISNVISKKYGYQQNDDIVISKQKFHIKDIYSDSNENNESTPSFVITKDDMLNLVFNPYLNNRVTCMVADVESSIYLSSNIIEDNNIIYGSNTILNNNEIGISKELAETYSKNLEDLIGKTICIDFYAFDSNLYFNQIDQRTYQFVVKYVYSESSGWRQIRLNPELNKELSSHYLEYNNGLYRLAVSINDKKTINQMYSEGLYDCTPISDELYSTVEWTKALNYVLLIFGGIVLVVVIINLINYLIEFMIQDQSMMGILASFGIEKKKIIWVYNVPSILTILSSFMIAIILQIGILKLINALLVGLKITSLDAYSFTIIPAVILLIICILVIVLCNFKLSSRFKRKTVIDIIYDR